MSYSVNFTNGAAKARLTITYSDKESISNVTHEAKSATVELHFSGIRDDKDDIDQNRYSPSDGLIRLSNPLNHTMPRFEFANGTEIGATSSAVPAALGSLHWSFALILPVLTAGCLANFF